MIYLNYWTPKGHCKRKKFKTVEEARKFGVKLRICLQISKQPDGKRNGRRRTKKQEIRGNVYEQLYGIKKQTAGRV